MFYQYVEVYYSNWLHAVGSVKLTSIIGVSYNAMSGDSSELHYFCHDLVDYAWPYTVLLASLTL